MWKYDVMVVPYVNLYVCDNVTVHVWLCDVLDSFRTVLSLKSSEGRSWIHMHEWHGGMGDISGALSDNSKMKCKHAYIVKKMA